MPGDYEGFAVTTILPDGTGPFSVGAGIDVLVRAEGAGSDVAESPLTTNADGEIVDGTIAALSPGDVVHFRVEEYEGVADSTSRTLT